MQELVLNQPVGTAKSELVREAAQADPRREFEERLAECGPLAFRVARGVLRNTEDAEDVARKLCCEATRTSGGFATAADSVAGWCGFLFGLHLTGCAPQSVARSAIRYGGSRRSSLRLARWKMSPARINFKATWSARWKSCAWT